MRPTTYTSFSMNQSCHNFNPEINFLSELSPTEISWDQHRSMAEDLAVLYNRNIKFGKYADRINGCSGYLKFGVDADQGKLVLKEVWFCCCRYCTVCQWRRTLKMRAMMYQNIDKIIQSYPTHRWVFLTLTVKTLMFLILSDLERYECRLAKNDSI